MAMSKQRKTSNILNIFSYDDAGNIVFKDYSQVIRYSWNGTTHGFLGQLSVSSIPSAIVDTDKFLVSDNGVLKYRTGAEVLTDIGGQNPITLTTTGASGASTFVNSTLNIPTYTLSGLGGVPSTRNITINGTSYDLSVDRTWNVGTVTSVGISMPSAFIISNSPITGSGIINITGAGTASQYIRGDGQLAAFPSTGSGGSSVSYYLNGGVAASVSTYYQMSKIPVTGAAADFTLAGNGLIAQFLTDVSDPNKLTIPGGNWNTDIYFSASDNTGTPQFYLELLKYDGVAFTSIASSAASPETITNGTIVDLYVSAIAVPQTTLLATDRFAIRVYVVNNVIGRTITLYTQDTHLCEIATTFAGGVSTINGLTENIQYLSTGTSGIDFNINSLTDTHVFNLPTASAINRGALSSSDWSVFNNKVSGSGVAGQVAYWSGVNTQAGSNNLFWDNINNRLGLGSTTLGSTLQINGNAAIGYSASTAAPTNGLLVKGGIVINGTTPLATGGLTLYQNLSYVSVIQMQMSIPKTSGESYLFSASTNEPTATTNLVLFYTGATLASNRYFTFQTSDSSGYLGNIVFQRSGGSVGIGTSTVGSNLQVNGNAAIGYSASTIAPANGLVVNGNALFGTTINSGFKIDVNGTSRLNGVTTIGTINNATIDTDRFLVSDAGIIKYRTGSELLSDIGAGTVTSVDALTLGTTGTDLSSSIATGTTTPIITLNVPSASAINRGVLTSTDWILFNAKESVLTFSSPLSRSINTISIPVATTSVSGYLSSIDWTTFNNKQNELNGIGFIKISGTTISYDNSTYYLASNPNGYTNNTGTVTSVAALTLGTTGIDITSTVATNTTTPVITLNIPTASATNRGALSSTDWTIFNTKVDGVTASSPLASSGGTTPNITIQQSSGSQAGYLSAIDWTTFNNKQNADNYITSLTGEATATGPGAATVTLNNASVTGKVLTGVNITGGTVQATDTMLVAFGKLQNQINSLIGSTIYQGTWNANTNTPTLTSGIGTKGYYYIVSVAGTTNLNGITNWFVGDWAIFDGTAWQKVDNTGSVVSVNGQTGAVSLTTDNISEGTINQYFTTSRARASLSFSAGSGNYNSSTGVITIPTNTNQLTNGASFITLLSLSGTAPIVYSNTTGEISITQSGVASNGFLSSTDWNTFNNKTSNLGTVTSVAALTIGTTGIDLSSSVATGTTTPVITLNVPTASATNRGALSSADWTTFNNKQSALSGTGFVKISGTTISYDNSAYYLASNPSGYTTNVGTVTSVAALTIGTTGTDITSSVATGTTTPVITLNIPTASGTNRGALSAADWTTFNGKYNLPSLTNGSVLFSNGTTIAQDNANFFWNDTNNRLGIGTVTLGSSLQINGNAAIGYSSSTAAPTNGLTVSGNIAIGLVTTTSKLQVSGSVNASASLAFGSIFNTTLVAVADYDTLVGVDISPTYTVGAFVEIKKIGLRVVGADASVNGIDIGIGAGSITSNTRVGAFALSANTTGASNTALGRNSLLNNTTGSFNTAIGQASLINNTSGFQNVAVGNSSLSQNTTGNDNAALGNFSLNQNTAGYSNIAIGSFALRFNTTGYQNNANGYNSLTNNTTGFNNLAFGSFALLSNTTGSNNTAIGNSAGYAGGVVPNTTGSNNIFIGNDSIGVSGTESNRTWIGSPTTTSTWLAGNLLLGSTTNGTDKLQVTGTGLFSSNLTTNGILTADLTSTGLTGAANLYGTSMVTRPTVNSGTTWGSFNVFINQQGIFQPTFNGSATFQSSNYVSQELKVNRITFASAASTVTMTQASGGIRAYSNAITHNYIDGTNNGTITHFANIAMYGDYASSAARFTFTNRYGLLINDFQEFAQGHTYTNRWAIYQDGASDNNYFKGKVIIGSTNTVGASPLNVKNLPISSAGLATGDVWNNGGVLNVIP